MSHHLIFATYLRLMTLLIIQCNEYSRLKIIKNIYDDFLTNNYSIKFCEMVK